MQSGLHIRRKRALPIIAWLFWAGFFFISGATAWYGYRFYVAGELPPVPIPVATARTDVDETPVTPEKKAEYTVPPTHPKLLSIAALNITDARVLNVGIKSNGEVDTPMNIHDIGWYNKSAMPGDGKGAVLLDGHNGGPTKGGVFEHLPKLREGAEIVMERGDGKKITYIVKENKTISLEDLNNGGMNQAVAPLQGDAQGLTLISCVGRWIPAQQTYDQRVVVRAVQKS